MRSDSEFANTTPSLFFIYNHAEVRFCRWLRNENDREDAGIEKLHERLKKQPTLSRHLQARKKRIPSSEATQRERTVRYK